jgi:hypothetical protein
MLSDAQIERWARQIVLPEVGGRGQARLLASRAGVVGDRALGCDVEDLLVRSGVQVRHDGTGMILFDLRLEGVGAAPAWRGPTIVARGSGEQATLTVLSEPPCPTCTARPSHAPTIAPLAVCTRRALAALAASEGLLALLAPERAPRRHRIDLSAGTFTSERLVAERCPHGRYAHD